ncbi:Fumarylacetoacetate (FAA) hydrolase family protein [Tistlia consotensis]|uniref:Fumarylacetoacetate (FAA) hydrolase family protein n=1 Tax=Tistlia consotensis USBA 355 TaxID=560819 RepID=A0A1Y6B887_9PROT|nr:fumarylacetoacetate hydrolase family protein [Tistlia consotensis]SME90472.1 Fumarylacetoacetate (FAA) hydrolase family protein [Tistlia consotensis USBA 355]SNR26762.1 Fumarylacetoacetate (FAA) hydrolase family protein [Tistlia consotensis]
MAKLELSAAAALPADGTAGTLAGRAWRPDVAGPAVVAIREAGVFDVTAAFPTMRDLCETADPAAALRAAAGEPLGTLEEILANTPPDGRDAAKPWLLAPVDLQALKAAGVTFAISMIERVIEERARGNPAAADGIRKDIAGIVGDDLQALKPGSEEALRLKEALIARGMWSQYLEVGIGPDAEIFTKAQPLSAVGTGLDAGLHPMSTWNNPEPEVVLVVASDGRIVGATLGNDVNLRDVEGRSALLLSKAKDNNASCVVGPFLRFFDGTFDLERVRRMTVSLIVEGEDNFRLEGSSDMSRISRDPADLVRQMVGPQHQYPDGAALFLGTLFAPTQDRDGEGQGFTHHLGDVVTVAAPELGSLVSRMRHSQDCEPWRFGAADLMRSLARRGLLAG